jgi:hypothetical protein
MHYCAQLDEDVREARRDELVSLQQRVGGAFAQSLVDQEVRPHTLFARFD